MVKYVLSLIGVFIVSTFAWYLIHSGVAYVGGAIIGLCVFFAFWVAVRMVFGSFDNFIKEVRTW